MTTTMGLSSLCQCTHDIRYPTPHTVVLERVSTRCFAISSMDTTKDRTKKGKDRKLVRKRSRNDKKRRMELCQQ